MPRWVKDYAIVAVVAVLVIGWFATRPGAPELSGSAPAVQLTRTDGVDFDLAEHAGKPVLLVFWAEWCGVCMQQVDDVNRLHAERQDIEILGIAVDSGPNKEVALHAKRHGIEFPVAATNAVINRGYQVAVLPTNVFIDANGDVSAAVAGALEFDDFNRRLQ